MTSWETVGIQGDRNKFMGGNVVFIFVTKFKVIYDITSEIYAAADDDDMNAIFISSPQSEDRLVDLPLYSSDAPGGKIFQGNFFYETLDCRSLVGKFFQ